MNVHRILPKVHHWGMGTSEESKCNYRWHEGSFHIFLFF